MSTELSLGEKRIRTQFNPANDSTVQHIKERGAEYINYLDANLHKPESVSDGEFFRLKALALTAIEEATMWAVKAATFEK